MFDSFKRRMNVNTSHHSVGEVMVERSNQIMDKTFANDQNYRRGFIYDWNMNPLEEVDFKFQKIKSRTAEGKEVEYFVQFKSGFNPESQYKHLHYRGDGRERFGFYIDVEDHEKGIYEKWLIVNKDSRVAFDRYNAFKCNWAFEWIYEGEYHMALGCVRDASSTTIGSNTNIEKLGGSIVDSEISIILPTTIDTRTILLGQRFIISDNTLNPQTYMITKIKDSSPLGIMRAFCKQRLYNPHTDYYGIINEEKNIDFKFDLPIDDLPDGYGGQYHAICDCVNMKGLPVKEKSPEAAYEISCDTDKLIIKGNAVIITLMAEQSEDEPESGPDWSFIVNNETYSKKDLTDYFEILQTENGISIRCINDIMNKYILSVCYGDENTVSNIIDLEVKF